MTDTEQAILQTLIELESMVQSIANANPKPSLRPIFARLDELAARLPPETDPRLLHYLAGKSYQKARLWLEGREAENAVGSCRR
ncbi:MAG: hypothetical protein HYY24_29025 [Verrucomicrobia bacterium]|nr:hypothetical protein [Verrucomicrobiota bacterium]